MTVALTLDPRACGIAWLMDAYVLAFASGDGGRAWVLASASTFSLQ